MYTLIVCNTVNTNSSNWRLFVKVAIKVAFVLMIHFQIKDMA